MWNSRPWDYSGCYLVLKDNLTYLSNSIDKYGHHLHKDKDVKKIRVCIKLIDRLLEDDYLKMDLIPESNLFNCDFIPQYFLPKGKFKGLNKIGENIKKQDRELLFKMLNKHLHSWWD